MFDIGFAELVLLAGLGLIILGPQRLPRVAAQLGRWVGQARRMSRTLMYQLRQEVNLDDSPPFSARRPAAPGGAKSAGARPAGKAQKAGEKAGEKAQETVGGEEKQPQEKAPDKPAPNESDAAPSSE